MSFASTFAAPSPASGESPSCSTPWPIRPPSTLAERLPRTSHQVEHLSLSPTSTVSSWFTLCCQINFPKAQISSRHFPAQKPSMAPRCLLNKAQTPYSDVHSPLRSGPCPVLSLSLLIILLHGLSRQVNWTQNGFPQHSPPSNCPPFCTHSSSSACLPCLLEQNPLQHSTELACKS